MKNYYLLLTFICSIYYAENIFSCPCKPTNNSQPFFEQYDSSMNDQFVEESPIQENNEKELSS